MKYKNGKKYRRMLGHPKKDRSIYNTIGHPYDIKGLDVIFIGENGESLCLTKGKKYKIIDTKAGKHYYDRELAVRIHNMKSNRAKCSTSMFQYDDYLLVLINDKGHKRKYNHTQFVLSEMQKTTHKDCGCDGGCKTFCEKHYNEMYPLPDKHKATHKKQPMTSREYHEEEYRAGVL